MSMPRHVLALPFPAQGHVIPLLKLSHRIADRGIKVTFVNTEAIHVQVMAADSKLSSNPSGIRFAMIPDGLETVDECRDVHKQQDSIERVIPAHLQHFIVKANSPPDVDEFGPIDFVLVDIFVGGALEVAEKMGIERAGFWPASASILALKLHIPKMIEDGVIDDKGTTLRNCTIKISEDIPTYKSDDFSWNFPGNLPLQRAFFERFMLLIHRCKQWEPMPILCNTCQELEAVTLRNIPSMLPIGPLMATHTQSHSSGSLWTEDMTSLVWLDQQQARSVIYVAFGSITIFSSRQFCELAHGLEDMGRPFLWVVRPDLVDGSVAEFHDGFLQRIRTKGKVVKWAPQQMVLAHPSIACFVTHCGWNSTLEALSSGVPLLCWPSFGDQRMNRSLICNAWRTGLGVDADESGFISKYEVRTKIEEVLCSEEIRANCLRLKEMTGKSVSQVDLLSQTSTTSSNN